MSQIQINELINRYRVSDGTGMINYAAFIENINSVTDKDEVLANTKSRAVFSDQDKDQMMDAITQMNNKIKAERILLKPGFMDFDRSQ